MLGRRRTVVGSLAIVLAMVGLTAASVPIYRWICQVTGLGGTPRIVASESAEVSNKTMIVRFDSNVMPGMPWRFRPDHGPVKVKLGESNIAVFIAENLSPERIVGTATFNVTPAKAATYISKIECFCFTQQELKAGERAELPVQFYIDPKIANDPETSEIKTVTLSYTFFKSKDQAPVKAATTLGSGKSGTTDRKEGNS